MLRRQRTPKKPQAICNVQVGGRASSSKGSQEDGKGTRGEERGGRGLEAALKELEVQKKGDSGVLGGKKICPWKPSRGNKRREKKKNETHRPNKGKT